MLQISSQKKHGVLPQSALVQYLKIDATTKDQLYLFHFSNYFVIVKKYFQHQLVYRERIIEKQNNKNRSKRSMPLRKRA